MPGHEGLLHISEVAERRINDVRDELREGDEVLVKVLAVEGNRIKLSRKAILKEQRGQAGPSNRARRERPREQPVTHSNARVSERSEIRGTRACREFPVVHLSTCISGETLRMPVALPESSDRCGSREQNICLQPDDDLLLLLLPFEDWRETAIKAEKNGSREVVEG